MQYPLDWNKTEDLSSVTFLSPSAPPNTTSSSQINKTSSKNGFLPTFREVLEITAQPLQTANMTLSDYVNLTTMALHRIAPNLKIVESTPISLTSNTSIQNNTIIPAHKLVFTYNDPFISLDNNSNQMKAQEIYTIVDKGIKYVISYIARQDKFDTYYPSIQEMINSFEIPLSSSSFHFVSSGSSPELMNNTAGENLPLGENKSPTTDLSSLGTNNIATETTAPAPSTGNTPPTATKVDVTTTKNTPIAIDLHGTDPDPNTSLVGSVVSGPTMGTLSEVDQTTGSVVYTPKQDITGNDAFTFKLNDGTADSNVADVSIVISDGINEAENKKELDK